MRMQPAHFRIGTLAKKVGVERFVIRFWEKEFQIKSHRSEGGQRFFTHKELETFKAIKDLLYEQKYTIEGAKKLLHENKKLIIGSYRTTLSPHTKTDELYHKLKQLQVQLIKLSQAL